MNRLQVVTEKSLRERIPNNNYALCQVAFTDSGSPHLVRIFSDYGYQRGVDGTPFSESVEGWSLSWGKPIDQKRLKDIF